MWIETAPSCAGRRVTGPRPIIHSFIHSFLHSFLSSFIHPFSCHFLKICSLPQALFEVLGMTRTGQTCRPGGRQQGTCVCSRGGWPQGRDSLLSTWARAGGLGGRRANGLSRDSAEVRVPESSRSLALAPQPPDGPAQGPGPSRPVHEAGAHPQSPLS